MFERLKARFVNWLLSDSVQISKPSNQDDYTIAPLIEYRELVVKQLNTLDPRWMQCCNNSNICNDYFNATTYHCYMNSITQFYCADQLLRKIPVLCLTN
jgi:hypothetical protein